MVAMIPVFLFMLLIIVYFVVKNQVMEKRVREYRSLLKSAQNQSRFTLLTLDTLAVQIQKTLIFQLESAHKRGLIKGEQYEKPKAIFNSFEYVVMQCCEHGATVEEALKRALAGGGVSLEEVKEFVAKLPSEIKVPWVKNNVSSFVLACTNINNHFLNPSSKNEITDQAS